MTCYIVPTAAAIIHYGYRKKKNSTNKYELLLNQLFVGGAIFGIVDHLWNGELFLFGENVLYDLALGLAITIAITFIASLAVLWDKIASRKFTVQS